MASRTLVLGSLIGLLVLAAGTTLSTPEQLTIAPGKSEYIIAAAAHSPGRLCRGIDDQLRKLVKSVPERHFEQPQTLSLSSI